MWEFKWRVCYQLGRKSFVCLKTYRHWKRHFYVVFLRCTSKGILLWIQSQEAQVPQAAWFPPRHLAFSQCGSHAKALTSPQWPRPPSEPRPPTWLSPENAYRNNFFSSIFRIILLKLKKELFYYLNFSR